MQDKHRLVFSHLIAAAGGATLGYMAGRMFPGRPPALQDSARAAGPTPHIYAASAKPNFYWSSKPPAVMFVDSAMISYLLDHWSGSHAGMGDGNIHVFVRNAAGIDVESVYFEVTIAHAPGQIGDLYIVRNPEEQAILRRVVQPWIDANAIAATEVSITGY